MNWVHKVFWELGFGKISKPKVPIHRTEFLETNKLNKELQMQGDKFPTARIV